MDACHIKLLSEDDFNHLKSFEKTSLQLIKNKFIFYVEDDDIADEVSRLLSQHTASSHGNQHVNKSEVEAYIRQEASNKFISGVVDDVAAAVGGNWYYKKGSTGTASFSTVRGRCTFYFLNDDDATHFKLKYCD